MPLVLVPIMGAEPVVPILSLSALLTNTSRTAAFHRHVDGRRALIVLIAAVPTCVLGAWAYTKLSGVGALIVIGSMLIASVPLRRLMRRHGVALTNRSLAAAAFGWGPLAGGRVGAGIILLSLLMAAGLEGAAVVATDAVISIGIGVAKFATFGLAWRGGREGDRGCGPHRRRGVSRRFPCSRRWSLACPCIFTPRCLMQWSSAAAWSCSSMRSYAEPTGPRIPARSIRARAPPAPTIASSLA
jgi:hypothetical protein